MNIFEDDEDFVGYREGVPVFVIRGTDPALADIPLDVQALPAKPFSGFTLEELGLALDESLCDLILLFPELGVEVRLGAEHLDASVTDAAHCTMTIA